MNERGLRGVEGLDIEGLVLLRKNHGVSQREMFAEIRNCYPGMKIDQFKEIENYPEITSGVMDEFRTNYLQALRAINLRRLDLLEEALRKNGYSS